MKEKKLVPKLRFPGFTEPWEQRKLGEIFKERNERSGQGELISVTVSQGVIKAADLDRDINASIDKHNYKVVKPGDVVYNTMRMWQGACGHSPYRGILSPAYTVLIPGKNTLGTLFDYYFKRIELLQIFKKYSQGMTSDTWNLKFDILKQVKLPFPSVEEQGKIVQLFSSCDANITLHQRKLEHLKLKKKSLLQKLFPKEGEVYPELRFPGFTEPWEQRKLGEVVKSYSGGTPIASNKEYYGGDIPFIRSAEINSDTTELYITQKGLDNSSAKIVEKGTILYAMYGATSGEVGISKINGAINQAILAMIPLDYDGEIISQYLRKNKESIIGKYLQGGQGNLSANIILELSIQLPGLEESNQIAYFLESVDNVITLHQRKLEHLQLLKKALLQQLFV